MSLSSVRACTKFNIIKGNLSKQLNIRAIKFLLVKDPATRNLVGIPIFNEEQYLRQTLRTLEPVMETFPTIDVLLFDDGSTDTTPLIMQETKDKWGERVLLASHSQTKGYGQTIIDILRFACQKQDQYDVAITFDADLQHDAATIPKILAAMNKEYIDLVSTSRYLDETMMLKGVQDSPVPYDWEAVLDAGTLPGDRCLGGLRSCGP